MKVLYVFLVQFESELFQIFKKNWCQQHLKRRYDCLRILSPNNISGVLGVWQFQKNKTESDKNYSGRRGERKVARSERKVACT